MLFSPKDSFLNSVSNETMTRFEIDLEIISSLCGPPSAAVNRTTPGASKP